MCETRSFEDAVRSAAVKAGLVPSNEGRDCPHSQATLIGLATATSKEEVLSPELGVLLLHTETCPVCRQTYRGLLAYMRAPRSEGPGTFFWDEGTSLGALFRAVRHMSFEGIQDVSAKSLFEVIYTAAKLTEAAAYEALGLAPGISEAEMLLNLRELGVPEEVSGLS